MLTLIAVLPLAIGLVVTTALLSLRIHRLQDAMEQIVAGQREDHEIMENIIRRQNTDWYEKHIAPYFEAPANGRSE